jgi:hypothetical protein
MDVSEIVKVMLEIVREQRLLLPDGVATIQQLVWKETLTGDPAAQEVLRELAYDLEHYEPDPLARSEDASVYGDERALAAIEDALARIERAAT